MQGSYNNGYQPDQPSNDAELNNLFVLDNVVITPSGPNTVVMSNARTSKVIEIQEVMSELVLYFNIFRTTEGHLLHIKTTLNAPENILNELKNTLVMLQQYGMLLTALDCKKLIIENNKISYNGTNTWVLGIHSCDRPDALAQLLSSAAPYLKEMPTKPKFVFVDDSRDSLNQTKNQEIVNDFCQTLGLPIHYWNRNKRSQFATNLGKKLPDLSDSIQWMLNPNQHESTKISTGLAKNFIQLHAINQKLILLDDDCLLTPLHMEHCQPGVSLDFNKSRFFAFQDNRQLAKKTNKSSTNPFEEHLNHLDSNLTHHVNLNDFSNIQIWATLTRHRAFQLNSKSYIGNTVNSIVGAQSTRRSDNFYYHADDAKQLNDFLQQNAQAQQLEQLSWHGPEQNSISKTWAFVCTTMSGLGALNVPIPTIPVGRIQDTFLGELCTYLYPNMQSFRFNWALLHKPTPIRTWNPNAAPTTGPLISAHILQDILKECHSTCKATTSEKRMLHYLNRLDAIVTADGKIIEKHITDLITTHFAREVRALNDIKDRTNKQPLYCKGIEHLLNTKKQMLVSLIDDASALKKDFLEVATPLIIAFKDWTQIIEYVQNQPSTLK